MMATGSEIFPTRVNQRIVTLDILRGVAICGILPINLLVMGTVGGQDGLINPARWSWDWSIWVMMQALFEGASRGLFTVLFGAGYLLMLRRAEDEQPPVAPFDIWARRCLALMALGVVQFAVFLWPGEILWFYGVAGLLLTAFRTARVRILFVVAAVLLLGSGGVRVVLRLPYVEKVELAVAAQRVKDVGGALNAGQIQALTAVDDMNANPTPKAMADEVRERTHLPSLFIWSAKGWVARHLAPLSWGSLAETVAFMLIGMGLYRTGIITGAAATSTYWRLLAFGYGIGLTLRVLNLAWQARAGFEVDVHKFSPAAVFLLQGALEEPARVGVTLGHLGLIVLAMRYGGLGRAGPLQALGRMALTVYSLQSIITTILFYGLRYVGVFGPAGLLSIAVAIWVITGIFCIVWLQLFTMGPAEWLLRAAAYGARVRTPITRRGAALPVSAEI